MTRVGGPTFPSGSASGGVAGIDAGRSYQKSACCPSRRTKKRPLTGRPAFALRHLDNFGRWACPETNGLEVMGTKKYYVRRDAELGPWTLAQVRQYLLTQGDPNPDYEVREASESSWNKASTIPELCHLFDPVSMTVQTTKGDSPNGKLKKVKH